MAAKSSNFMQEQDFSNSARMILDSMYNQSLKLGAAYPRRLMTIGVCHARMDDGLDSSAGSVSSTSQRGGAQGSKGKARDRAQSEDDHAEEVLALTAKASGLRDDVDTSQRSNLPATPRSVNVSFAPGTPMSGRSSSFFGGGGGGGGLDEGSSDSRRKSHKYKPPASPDDMHGDPLMGSKHATPSLSLESRFAFAMKLPSEARERLGKVMPIEHLYESRVGSFERYISMLVAMHAMAEVASKPWLLPSWDTSRSQSNLRVATTACPVCVEEEEDILDLSSTRADSLHTEEFDSSKHTIIEAKKRIGDPMDDVERLFPPSNIVAVEEEDEIKKKAISKVQSVPSSMHLGIAQMG